MRSRTLALLAALVPAYERDEWRREVAENCVVFRDVDTYSLDDLFEAAKDLSEAVKAAQASAGERHRSELAGPHPLEY